MRPLLAIAAVALLAVPARAQDLPPETPLSAGADDLVLELGIGGKVVPAYEGADDYLLQPWPIAQLHYLRLPVLGDFGGGPKSGISFGPSFRYVAERDEDDYSELEGLGDVSAAYEFGATIGYRYEFVRAFVTLRQGFGGHHGLVGEVGVDAIADPMPKLTVSLGPRLGLASSDYLDTYLGVDPGQSAASGLPEFDPDGGIKGVGLEAEARYSLTPAWSVVANAGYERLVGDAADSPVTDLGSENQFTAGIGVSYRFGLDLFK
jgi:outer membrane protein